MLVLAVLYGDWYLGYKLIGDFACAYFSVSYATNSCKCLYDGHLIEAMHKPSSTIVQVELRGGWTRLERYLNILLLITFFRLVFHMSLNSRNTKLKNAGVHWDLLDI